MADYQTKQRRRNTIVGIFVVVAFVAFIWMLVKFRDLPLVVSKFKCFEILVYFPEAPGIQKDTPVKYCGYQIGRVMKVAPPRRVEEGLGMRSHQVGVTIAIERRYSDIPLDAEIMILKRGLGSSYIELLLNPSRPEKPETYLEDKMVLVGTVGMASEFFPPEMQKKLEGLVDSIAALTDNANEIIGNDENQANLQETLKHVAVASAEAKATIASFRRLSDAGTQQVEKLGAQADETMASIKKFSDTGTEKTVLLADSIASVTDEMEATLSQVRQLIAKIDEGDGTMGKLVNDPRLYENLLESSQELEAALKQIKQWAADIRDKGIRIKW